MKWTKKKVRMKTTDYRMTEGMRKKRGLYCCLFVLWQFDQHFMPIKMYQTFDCVYVYNMLYSLLWLSCVCVIVDGVNGGQPGHVTKVKSPSVCVFLSLCHLSWALHPTSFLHECMCVCMCVCVCVCVCVSVWAQACDSWPPEIVSQWTSEDHDLEKMERGKNR